MAKDRSSRVFSRRQPQRVFGWRSAFSAAVQAAESDGFRQVVHNAFFVVWGQVPRQT